MTYAQLHDRICRAGNVLEALGVGREDRVLMILDDVHWIDAATTYHATHKLLAALSQALLWIVVPTVVVLDNRMPGITGLAQIQLPPDEDLDGVARKAGPGCVAISACRDGDR